LKASASLGDREGSSADEAFLSYRVTSEIGSRPYFARSG
jgi:hypothetical protein